MAKSKHVRGKSKGNFCGTTGSRKCTCPKANDYRDNGDPGWQPAYYYQSHHLLPVSCVKRVLTGKKTNFDPVLKATVWCINAKDNMYGMPIWGTTVEHYCKIAKGATALNMLLEEPAFAGIPQHLCDHDLYNTEVQGHLLSVDAACNSAGHDLTASDIAEMLDTLSEIMLDELKERGSTRTNGTHVAWTNAVQASEVGQELPGWYLPFSMAEAPRKRGFPLKGKGKSLRGWITKIGAALSKSI